MADITFYGSLLGFTALAPMKLSKSVNYYSPLTYQVHQWALTCEHGQERTIQLLHYIAKPADRLIQAVVAPIFKVLEIGSLVRSCLKGLSSNNNNSVRSVSVLCLAISPIIGCAFLIGGLAETILFSLNGTLQVIFPYQAIYAIFKGKEAAKEYFEIREKYSDQTGSSVLPKCFVWENPPNVEKPATPINTYLNDIPTVVLPTDVNYGLRRDEALAAQLITNPGISKWIIRMILLT